MDELGQLEEQHAAFAKRNVRVVVVSNDDLATAAKTQAQFPDLTVVSDTHQNLAKSLQVVQPGIGPGGTDTNAPTTFLVDGGGTVRWLFRPDRFIERLAPDQVLAAIDNAEKR